MINPSNLHQPKNILDHYYKKVTSPDSNTNEYASIIKDPPKPLSPRNIVTSSAVVANVTSAPLNNTQVRSSRFGTSE